MVAAVWRPGKMSQWLLFLFFFFFFTSVSQTQTERCLSQQRWMENCFTWLCPEVQVVGWFRVGKRGENVCVHPCFMCPSQEEGPVDTFSWDWTPLVPFSHKKPDVLVDATTSGSSVKEDEAVWYCTATHSLQVCVTWLTHKAECLTWQLTGTSQEDKHTHIVTHIHTNANGALRVRGHRTQAPHDKHL